MKVNVPFFNRQMGATDITNPIEGIETGQALLDDIAAAIPGLRARGIDTTGLTRQTARVRSMLDDTNLTAVSQMAEKSPALSTRLDELRNEIFRLMIQRDAVTRGMNNPTQLIMDIDSIVAKMLKDGRLSAAQAAEAKAAGLSTLLNFNALKTFQPKLPTGVSASSALDELIGIARDPAAKKAFTSLAEPYIRGTNSIINSSGVRSFTAPFKPAFKRMFGSAPYQIDEYASNPLGNQSLTFVPTASTAASIAGGKKVGLNIAGIIIPMSSTATTHSISRPNLVAVGTIVWLSSELMFFAGLFAIYFTTRAVQGPTIWSEGAELLSLPFAAANTTILVLSSVTCQFGVFAAERFQNKRTGSFLQMSKWGMREWFALTFA